MVRRIGTIVIALLCLVASQFFNPVAHAQTTQLGVGVTVIPPLKIYQSVDPGNVEHDKVRIQNVDTRVHTIVASPQSFVSDAQGRGCVPTPKSRPNSLISWLTVTPSQVTLQPNQQFEFDYTMSVPADAGPGGHYGALVFQVVPDQLPSGASGVTNVIGGTTCFLVTVSGDLRYGATLASFGAKVIKLKETSQPRALPGAEQVAITHTLRAVRFITKIKNTGNAQFAPTGQITISNIWGNKRAPIPIEEGQGSKYVLPGTTRTFQTDWKRPPIGFYRAQVKVFYDQHHPVLAGEVTFWILPPFWIWLLILALILFLIWIWKSRKRILRGVRAFREGSSNEDSGEKNDGDENVKQV